MGGGQKVFKDQDRDIQKCIKAMTLSDLLGEKCFERTWPPGPLGCGLAFIYNVNAIWPWNFY